MDKMLPCPPVLMTHGNLMLWNFPEIKISMENRKISLNLPPTIELNPFKN